MSEHRYPSNYQPGAHWASDEAWRILDCLPAGKLADDERFVTAGRIAGALMRRSYLRDPPKEDGRDQVVHILRAYASQPYADISNGTVRVRAVLLTTAADMIERLQEAQKNPPPAE